MEEQNPIKQLEKKLLKMQDINLSNLLRENLVKSFDEEDEKILFDFEDDWCNLDESINIVDVKINNRFTSEINISNIIDITGVFPEYEELTIYKLNSGDEKYYLIESTKYNGYLFLLTQIKKTNIQSKATLFIEKSLFNLFINYSNQLNIDKMNISAELKELYLNYTNECDNECKRIVKELMPEMIEAQIRSNKINVGKMFDIYIKKEQREKLMNLLIEEYSDLKDNKIIKNWIEPDRKKMVDIYNELDNLCILWVENSICKFSKERYPFLAQFFKNYNDLETPIVIAFGFITDNMKMINMGNVDLRDYIDGLTFILIWVDDIFFEVNSHKKQLFYLHKLINNSFEKYAQRVSFFEKLFTQYIRFDKKYLNLMRNYIVPIYHNEKSVIARYQDINNDMCTIC